MEELPLHLVSLSRYLLQRSLLQSDLLCMRPLRVILPEQCNVEAKVTLLRLSIEIAETETSPLSLTKTFFKSKSIEANIHAPKVINHRTILATQASCSPARKRHVAGRQSNPEKGIIRSSQHLVLAITVAAIALVLVLAGLAPVLPCVLGLVTGESASEGSEETVVCLSAKDAATNATCDGAHETTVTLLAVGVIWVTLAVLVTLGASG